MEDISHPTLNDNSVFKIHKSKNESFESPLKDFDNVFITPHIGGSTIEAQENIANEVSKIDDCVK